MNDIPLSHLQSLGLLYYYLISPEKTLYASNGNMRRVTQLLYVSFIFKYCGYGGRMTKSEIKNSTH